jgi:Rieske Fe-S protein
MMASSDEADDSTPPTSAVIGRREFLRRMEVLSVGVACGGLTAAVGACSGARYVTATPTPDNRLLVPRAVFEGRGHALVQWPGSELPIYVRHSEADAADGDAWTAVWTQCTHQGCQVEPAGDRLACPCHGSEYTFEGQVLQGPAPLPLRRFRVTEEGDHLAIHLTQAGVLP